MIQVTNISTGGATILGTDTGTDGYGRSDTREKLRRFFEVDRYYVTVAALKALSDDGTIEPARVQEAIERYKIDADAAMPTTV